MKITLNIKDTDFPMLLNIKKNEITNTILKLLETGYKIHFPDIYDITNKIDILKKDINNNDINDKLISLETNLNKLIGLSSNSYKKGNLGECILEDIFKNRYGDIKYEKKNHIPHSGDAWIYLPDNKIIMLESKNYTSTVNKDEIIKLQNDMIKHHIKWSIMISFNSLIQGMNDLDLHTFVHNNETYYVIMISNLIIDIHKLDLGLQIIRKLIINFDNIIDFPWIIENINQSMNELNNIIKKNYYLRDQYYNMEKDIQKSLSNYYNLLREYQYDTEKKINEIINIINNTVKNSINLNNTENYINELNKNYNDKKIYPLIIRLIDMIKSKEWIIQLDNITDFNIYDNNKIEIIKGKIQLKKIILNIVKLDIVLNLNLNKENDIKSILNILSIII